MVTLHDLIAAPDNVAAGFLSSTYPALAQKLVMPVTYVAIFYWAWLGVRIYQGHAPAIASELFAKVIMTVLVFATLNWSSFAQSIYNAFKGVCDGSAIAILGGQSADTLLDGLIQKVEQIANVLLNQDAYKIAMIFLGYGLFILNCMLFIVSLYFLVISKIGLAVTMVLLPLFSGFFFFSATRQWGMNWISKMLNFTFIYVLVCAIVRFGFSAFGTLIEQVGQATTVKDAAVLTATYVVVVAVIEGVLILFMLQVKGWAAALSGGATVQGVSAVLGAAGALRGAMK